MRAIQNVKPYRFATLPWEIVETSYVWKENRVNETLFTIGNGYLGVRGGFEEGFFEEDQWHSDPSTYINGIYEYRKLNQTYTGHPERNHGMINVTRGYSISLQIGDELFHMSHGKIKEYKRVLDLKKGILTRSLHWVSPNGKEVSITIQRFASLADSYTLAVRYTVTPVNFSEPVTIISELQGSVKNDHFDKSDADGNRSCLALSDSGFKDGAAFINQTTNESGFFISTVALTAFDDSSVNPSQSNDPGKKLVQEAYTIDAKCGKSYTLDKVITYRTSRETPRPDCFSKNLKHATSQAAKGFGVLRDENEKKWAEFWECVDITIEGDAALQQAVRYSQFQTMISTGKDGLSNIGANGLSGNLIYQGHVFWDTEIYIFPMFLYTYPEIARQLLMYRYSILDKARERAKQMNEVGAHYSWNSISGEECGTVYEASHAQYHINNAIAYAIFKYYEATGDKEFLENYGAEIVFETAKCMAHRGHFNKYRDNKFCINMVCGPDEYNPMIDNNCYTNTMTKFHLNFACDIVEQLKTSSPILYASLKEKIGLTNEEVGLWKKAADNMYIPYSKELDLLLQDDNFLNKDPVDLIKEFPDGNYGPLTAKHPLHVWRYQFVKQADLVLLMFLQGHLFSKEMKKNVYDFYEPKTIHGSSLSPCIHSIVASEIGYTDDAYAYFLRTARLDLDVYAGTVFFGLHAACMGAAWMVIVNGFGGTRVFDGKLHFKPYIPKQWDKYDFKMQIKGSVVKVSVTKTAVEYTLLKGADLEIIHCNKTIVLQNGKSVCEEPWDQVGVESSDLELTTV